MKQFKFTLTWNEAIEKLYEYYISECEKHFSIPNRNVAFYIYEPSNKQYFCMMAFNDNIINIDEKVEIDSLPITNIQYQTKWIGDNISVQSEIINGYTCLDENEVRFLKLSFNQLKDELCKMCYKMVSECLKTDCQEGILLYNQSSEVFTYQGHYQSKFFCFKRNQCEDITEKIRNCWF